jgi:hypothetical protein
MAGIHRRLPPQRERERDREEAARPVPARPGPEKTGPRTSHRGAGLRATPSLLAGSPVPPGGIATAREGVGGAARGPRGRTGWRRRWRRCPRIPPPASRWPTPPAAEAPAPSVTGAESGLDYAKAQRHEAHFSSAMRRPAPCQTPIRSRIGGRGPPTSHRYDRNLPDSEDNPEIPRRWRMQPAPWLHR